MNDPIINNINDNRDAFDNDRPDAKVWENIHQELHPENKKRKFIWLKLAAVLVVALGALWFFNQPETHETALASNEKETPVDSVNNDGTDSATVSTTSPDKNRRIHRGGSWKNLDYYLKSGKQKNAEPSYIAFRGVLAEKGRNMHLYMDQTEVTNNEYRDYVNNVRDKKYEFSHDLNPDEPYTAEDQDAVSYQWDFGDVNNCVTQQEIHSGFYYEQYDQFEENEFVKALQEHVSTFSIDVDAAGYSNMRRYINDGFIPPKDAVKLEEMVNYFKYDLPEPTGKHPFSITTEVGKCPWNQEHRLMQIAIKGKDIPQENFPASNLVFLIDVSGSMEDANKLPLLIQGFKMLVNELREKDRVAIVTYAGSAGLVLPSTSGEHKEKILEALENLSAGGSTAGGEGIIQAYSVASENFIKGGNNRVILATDGDFNVGVSDDASLVRMIEEKRKSGVFLSVLAFGEGNLQSSKMEKIADNGNGNYSYIDNVLEAKKVLVTEMGATLHTIAKDVKLQLEFNKESVESYRLLGYENRMLAEEDFENDLKDAGDLGSGHTIVAFYELVLTKKAKLEASKSDLPFIFSSDELPSNLVTIKFRYKKPEESKSNLMSVSVRNAVKSAASENFLFASAVAEFGLLIRDSKYKGDASFNALIKRAQQSKGTDVNGYRAEFIQLAEKGKILMEEYNSHKK